jgi:DnaK suppressor protein
MLVPRPRRTLVLPDTGGDRGLARAPAAGDPRAGDPDERTRAVMDAVHDHATALHKMLEEQFEAHTGRLMELITRGGHPGNACSGDRAACTLWTSSRQELADIAHALRRMAEGSYGTCELCGRTIPAERLESQPQARYCVPCESGTDDPAHHRPDPHRLQEASRVERS